MSTPVRTPPAHKQLTRIEVYGRARAVAPSAARWVTRTTLSTASGAVPTCMKGRVRLRHFLQAATTGREPLPMSHVMRWAERIQLTHSQPHCVNLHRATESLSDKV